jgi:hypothetical protein
VRAALAIGLAVILVAVPACGARQTFDEFDRMCFAAIRLGPEVQATREAQAATITAEIRSSLVHYVRFGGLFKVVEPHCPTTPADTSVIVEATVREFTPDEGRMFSLAGGRARGNALIRYTFRNKGGEMIHFEDIRSFARSGLGSFTDVPEPLGGVDATVEGAGAHLHWWLRRNKSNPGAATVTAAPK